MKKRIAILVALALVATGAFAQFSMSTGGGLLANPSFNNGVDIEGGGVSGSVGLDITSIGGFAFFDVTYVELDVSFAYGIATMYTKGAAVDSGTDDTNIMSVGFTLLGKYPINLGKITIFPLLGVEYNLVLWEKDGMGDGYKPMDLSQLGFQGGVGLDFGLTNKLFLRAETLFQLRLPNKVMNDTADESDKSLGSYGNADATFGMGPVIKVGVGFKL